MRSRKGAVGSLWVINGSDQCARIRSSLPPSSDVDGAHSHFVFVPGGGDISECSIGPDLVEFAVDLSSVSLSSQRLFLKSFGSEDAFEAFEATTPTLTRFMKWEPAPSLEAFAAIWQSWIPVMCAGMDVHFVVRVKSTLEFLGMAGLHNTNAAEPETGIWIRESQHGHGYGREAVAAVISFAGRQLRKRAVVYPVVEQNGSSRRLAESLGGVIVGARLLRKAGSVKLPEVVYRIPTSTGDS